ncbi:MAG: DNA polymerase Y family protein [Acidimicrobiales bacterium]|nr:DNA polymerase Y family protein [Acidimicrobiales bacterium]
MTGLTVPPTTVRTLVVDCPDWPLTALVVDPDEPVLVLGAGRVVAATAPARGAGVARGQRRCEAQRLCPEARVLARDEVREARGFEAVISALEGVTPWVTAQWPGWCSFGVQGPIRLFGGEVALVRHTTKVVTAAIAQSRLGTDPECRIGVADGAFAAGLAARSSGVAPEGAVIVPQGGSPDFLAPLPVEVLTMDGLKGDLANTLVRLGLVTLGAFAALPAADVLARFGADGLDAHRLASGVDDRLVGRRPVSPDLAVPTAFDPPVEQIDRTVFAARLAAEVLHERLSSRGIACTQIVIEVETENGEHISRRWRDGGTLSPTAVVDRVRWQLEGWLHGPPALRPTSGITLLVLVPDEVALASGHQLGFWGEASAADKRAGQACARVVGLLGPGSVQVPEWQGGRDPDTQVALTPFVELVEETGLAGQEGRLSGLSDKSRSLETPPWPGALPQPFPAAVHVDPVVVEVVDATGTAVTVDGRGGLSGVPNRLAISLPFVRPYPEATWRERITAWAGPWPIDERWWDQHRRRRGVRIQVVTADGVARLVVLADGQWKIAATYD